MVVLSGNTKTQREVRANGKKTGGKEATEISKGAKEIRHMRRTVKGNMSNQKGRLKKPRFNYKCNIN